MLGLKTLRVSLGREAHIERILSLLQAPGKRERGRLVSPHWTQCFHFLSISCHFIPSVAWLPAAGWGPG